MEKRQFLKHLGRATMVAPFVPWTANGNKAPSIPQPYPNTDDDRFWERIREDFDLKPDYINLENGYYCITPRPIMQKLHEHTQMVNYEGSFYMRNKQWENKERVTQKLAKFVGCRSESLIITRNTTESLDMIIGGFPWEKGDEAIFAEQDYGAMKDHFYLVRDRYGIVCKEVSVPNHPKSDDEIVELYESQITPKTKLLMVCHMINITGHILPIKKICEMAHKHGVEVMVDGAHAVGHIDVNIEELNCDYYGSSLHKWLSAPLGNGLLYVAPKNISKIWPLLAEHKREETDILRLNHTGTNPVHIYLAINEAIDYLELIGIRRKEERLRFLQKYWSDQLRNIPNISVNTPKEGQRSCGIGNVGITHIKPEDLAKVLLDEFKIWTVAIDGFNVRGCRITPNIYTTTKELDTFVTAMKTLAKRI
ncbi:aminotransferase class V-fold PLP-dependent enzyme [Flagellimonas nanhaiensis]|uniref:Aminotransferase class V-fold PLP-dependent enzyme n=1 Tax=Flagellimonas nanhaiensis TaxID=2292706 RepID=A0A371JPM6_9FLAO|nr:aminotransferase class V-fold PLP-dependent enzyme [Allomuricauda nanhaiensis]RDY59470.1 aminotransferase class V-fold PLP-dependent enzyme [Allomuricauda nanhaiensis]